MNLCRDGNTRGKGYRLSTGMVGPSAKPRRRVISSNVYLLFPASSKGELLPQTTNILLVSEQGHQKKLFLDFAVPHVAEIHFLIAEIFF